MLDDINSTSLGVNVNDSTAGRTFANTIVGNKPMIITNAAKNDFTFMTSPDLFRELYHHFTQYILIHL